MIINDSYIQETSIQPVLLKLASEIFEREIRNDEVQCTLNSCEKSNTPNLSDIFELNDEIVCPFFCSKTLYETNQIPKKKRDGK